LTSTEIKISSYLEKGIEFSCQMCGKCCTGLNEGEVYLYEKDVLRLTKLLNIRGIKHLREFAEKYFKIVDDSFFWKEPGAQRGKTYRYKSLGFKFTGEDEHCHFLKNNICTVHEARPFQCRSFPFWQMMVSSKKNFDTYTKKCKGLQLLKGKFHTREEILKWAQDEYEMEKKYFFKMKKHNFDILKVYPFLSSKMLQK
jgi:Fe-S-cluster containining protein